MANTALRLSVLWQRLQQFRKDIISGQVGKSCSCTDRNDVAIQMEMI